MVQTAVAIRHVAFEDLGVIDPLLAERGYAVTYLEAGIDPIGQQATEADLLVVLGGPLGLGDLDAYPFLRDEITVVRQRIRDDRPTLGICLGAQLIAAALGARVRPTGKVEIGYSPLQLTPQGKGSVLSPLADEPVLHWHGDAFEIPEGAQRLAETPGFPHQAFSYGNQVLGLQFHAEANPTQIERWLVGHAHELTTNGLAPTAIRADAQTYGPALATRSRAAFSAWLDQLRSHS